MNPELNLSNGLYNNIKKTVFRSPTAGIGGDSVGTLS